MLIAPLSDWNNLTDKVNADVVLQFTAVAREAKYEKSANICEGHFLDKVGIHCRHLPEAIGVGEEKTPQEEGKRQEIGFEDPRWVPVFAIFIVKDEVNSYDMPVG